MAFLSWLRNRIPSRARGRGRAHVAPRKRAHFRPRVEALEGRDVPTKVTGSPLTVTNTQDSGAGSQWTEELRRFRAEAKELLNVKE